MFDFKQLLVNSGTIVQWRISIAATGILDSCGLWVVKNRDTALQKQQKVLWVGEWVPRSGGGKQTDGGSSDLFTRVKTNFGRCGWVDGEGLFTRDRGF